MARASVQAREVARRGDVVVQRVLDATVDEVAQVGFTALTLERVAARAGVNRTTIFRRWPNKSRLVLAAMERALEQIDFDIDLGDMRAELTALVANASKGVFSTGTVGLYRVLFDASDQEDLARLAFTARKRVRRQVQLLMGRWRARGELRADIDAQTFFQSILGVLCMRIVFNRQTMTPAFTRRIVDHFCSIAALPAADASARSAPAPRALRWVGPRRAAT